MGMELPIERLVEGATHMARNDRVFTRANGDQWIASVPQPELYPHQWNWDSMLVAWANAEIGNVDRALAECISHFSAQHASGRVPHIAYDPAGSDEYFPQHRYWGDDLRGLDGRYISGITQPTLAGMALEAAVRAGADVHSPVLRALVRRAHREHQWFVRERDPLGSGDIVLVNAWESGRDNGPDYMAVYADPALRRMNGTAQLRTDLARSDDPDGRPTHEYYATAMGTTLTARELGGFDAPGVAARMQVQVSDPMMMALLAASTARIGALASRMEMTDVAHESAAIVAMLSTALRRRASTARDGRLYALDARHDQLLTEHLTIAHAMGAWLPGVADELLVRIADDVADGGPLAATDGGVMSATAGDHYFDPKQYWRGPSWPHMDELVARGLLHAAHEPTRPALVRVHVQEAVAQLDARVRAAYARDGAPEYRHALDGSKVGKGGMSFSNAAMLMFAQRHGRDLQPARAAFTATSAWSRIDRARLAALPPLPSDTMPT